MTTRVSTQLVEASCALPSKDFPAAQNPYVTDTLPFTGAIA